MKEYEINFSLNVAGYKDLHILIPENLYCKMYNKKNKNKNWDIIRELRFIISKQLDISNKKLYNLIGFGNNPQITAYDFSNSIAVALFVCINFVENKEYKYKDYYPKVKIQHIPEYIQPEQLEITENSITEKQKLNNDLEFTVNKVDKNKKGKKS